MIRFICRGELKCLTKLRHFGLKTGDLMNNNSVCVLGAGVVGVSTAVNIQNAFPGIKVTIKADKFNSETTSDGAAGVFRPTSVKTTGNLDVISKFCKDSFDWYHKLWSSEDAPIAGIHRLNGYICGKEPCPEQIPLYCYDCRELTTNDLARIPGTPKHGYFCDTIMIECRRYLPWLLNKFRQNGGIVKKEKIKSLHEIAGQYDVYVNCLGLEAREVFNDAEMYPVRGHLLRVHAPWVKNIYFYDGITYIYPGQDNVVLGGTREKGDEDLDYDENKFMDILKRCSEILPGLKDAKILNRWVGLRPHRTSLRVEPELIRLGDHTLKVVHNVGHGGDGVALSWGSAMEAARLVGTLLKTDSKL